MIFRDFFFPIILGKKIKKKKIYINLGKKIIGEENKLFYFSKFKFISSPLFLLKKILLFFFPKLF